MARVQGPKSTAAARATLAGFAAILVGIGLGRFAYTPLIPALIAEGWASPAVAAYIGAANLAGYLIGALAALRIAARYRVTPVLRTMMILAAASFFACAWPLSDSWLVGWRAAAGVAGGVLMVLGAPAVLAVIPEARRGLAGGIIFSAVGLGIIAAGTLVPLLMTSGLVATWCGLGALAAVLTAIAWRGWPDAAGGIAAVVAGVAAPRPAGQGLRLLLLALLVGYGLDAVGVVPHMVFLSDFVARDLGRGIAAGAHVWVLFGIGAAIGPAMAGHLGDRIGFGRALRLAFLVQSICVALLAVATEEIAIAASSVIVGALVPGIAPLALGRVHELLSDGTGRRAAWRRATVAFAVGQAAGGYGFSYLLEEGFRYPTLFMLAAGALFLALAIDLMLSAAARTRCAAGGRRGAT